MYGAAGAGKSAISRTVAELCARSDRLSGSFFFLRRAGRRSSITHFISTLAYNLAFFVPTTRLYIERVLQRDQYIIQRSLERQFQQLIVDPIRSAVMPPLPMVIIVDALDECDDKGMIADFIEIVAHAIANHRLPLCFLFTSRVEEHIRKQFSVSPALSMTHCLALENFNAAGDIRTFFRSRFSKNIPTEAVAHARYIIPVAFQIRPPQTRGKILWLLHLCVHTRQFRQRWE